MRYSELRNPLPEDHPGPHMKTPFLSAAGFAMLLVAQSATAQMTLYDGEGLRGHVFTANNAISNLERYGFNDRASSVVVQRGEWEVCEHANFQGNCMVLRPGQYPSLAAMGMSNRISSLAPRAGAVQICGCATAAAGPGTPIRTIHTMARRSTRRMCWPSAPSLGPPEQRCWVEQQQVVSQQRAERPRRDHRRRARRCPRSPDRQRPRQ